MEQYAKVKKNEVDQSALKWKIYRHVKLNNKKASCKSISRSHLPKKKKTKQPPRLFTFVYNITHMHKNGMEG